MGPLFTGTLASQISEFESMRESMCVFRVFHYGLARPSRVWRSSQKDTASPLRRSQKKLVEPRRQCSSSAVGVWSRFSPLSSAVFWDNAPFIRIDVEDMIAPRFLEHSEDGKSIKGGVMLILELNKEHHMPPAPLTIKPWNIQNSSSFNGQLEWDIDNYAALSIHRKQVSFLTEATRREAQ
ncbi:hypothetical protein N431DRAFT_535994 [Stipitochalara longipes BDJ]|nr:hypothetical protein N431DRAFT_535994 [Stipitochalara longipes BDJ]